MPSPPRSCPSSHEEGAADGGARCEARVGGGQGGGDGGRSSCCWFVGAGSNKGRGEGGRTGFAGFDHFPIGAIAHHSCNGGSNREGISDAKGQGGGREGKGGAR